MISENREIFCCLNFGIFCNFKKLSCCFPVSGSSSHFKFRFQKIIVQFSFAVTVRTIQVHKSLQNHNFFISLFLRFDFPEVINCQVILTEQ
jgi:hypothetical protein